LYAHNDESSVGTPEKTHQESKEGTRPVTPDVEQMREETFKDQEQETILQDEDETVEEVYPTYSQDSQEYMHWHYRLNHPYTHSHDQDSKAEHVTKENKQNPSRHGKATQQTTNV
jgi:hypothetical protein